MFDPVLYSAISLDGIAALILTAIWCVRREIRGRVLPFFVLTLVHGILVPVCFYFQGKVLRDIYVFSPLVLLLFFLIYTAVLSEHTKSRMTRHLGICCFIFCVNIIFQGLLTVVFLIGGYTG